MPRRLLAAPIAAPLLLAAGCAAPAVAPAPEAAPPVASAPAGRIPELIPLSHLFASPEPTWGFRPSPDGTRLAWIGSHDHRTTVLFRVIDLAAPGGAR